MGSNPSELYNSTPGANAPQEQPRKKFVLPEYSPQYENAYQIDQEFSIRQTLFTFPPAPLNTKSNNAAFGLADVNAILTSVSQAKPEGSGFVSYTATFARVPSSWDDFKSMPFTFPGFPGTIGQNNTRNEFSQKVDVRLRYDYFLVDPTAIATGILDSSGNAVTVVSAMGAIPTINKKYFLVATANGISVGANGIRTNSIVQLNGKTIGSVNWFQTLPQLATYLQWILNAAPYLSPTPPAWTQTTPPVWNGTSDNGAAATEGQIVMDDSILQPYAGNIIARVTPYILIR